MGSKRFQSYGAQFQKSVPKEAAKMLSPDLIGRAEGFVQVRSLGIPYWIAVTKETKQAFGMSILKGKLYFSEFKGYQRFNTVAGDIVRAIYLQARETVGDGIKRELMESLQNKMEEVFGGKLDEVVDGRLGSAMPALPPADGKLKGGR